MEPEAEKNSLPLVARLEALLFAHGEGLSQKKAMKLLGVDESTLKEAIETLKKQTSESNRGIFLMKHEGELELVTKPEYKHILEALVTGELDEALTPAAQETLAIIAYTAPTLRSEIDHIRGVNSAFTLRALLIRGLIEKKVQGKNTFYSVSSNFLKHLGLSRPEDLPDFESMKKAIAVLREAPKEIPKE